MQPNPSPNNKATQQAEALSFPTHCISLIECNDIYLRLGTGVNFGTSPITKEHSPHEEEPIHKSLEEQHIIETHPKIVVITYATITIGIVETMSIHIRKTIILKTLEVLFTIKNTYVSQRGGEEKGNYNHHQGEDREFHEKHHLGKKHMIFC